MVTYPAFLEVIQLVKPPVDPVNLAFLTVPLTVPALIQPNIREQASLQNSQLPEMVYPSTAIFTEFAVSPNSGPDDPHPVPVYLICILTVTFVTIICMAALFPNA